MASVRIVFHPAPSPQPDGSVRRPDPVHLPADPVLLEAWLERRLGLTHLAGSTIFTAEPLTIEDGDALTSEVLVIDRGPAAPSAARGDEPPAADDPLSPLLDDLEDASSDPSPDDLEDASSDPSSSAPAPDDLQSVWDDLLAADDVATPDGRA